MKQIVVFFVILTLAAQVHSEQNASPSDKNLVTETSELAQVEVGKYQLRLEADSKTDLELLRKPILHWSNPTVGTVYGDVFLWTLNGRPEAVGSFYRFYKPHQQTVLELQSLSKGGVSARGDSGVVWHTSRPGIQLEEVPGAPNPADNRLRRSPQMKRVARRFKAQLSDSRSNLGQTVRRDLRLLSQPVYRYPRADGSLMDGAIFAFVEGTDPEAFLLIEAHKKNGRLMWYSAFARMNMEPLIGFRDGKQVWSAPRLEAPWQTTDKRYQLVILPEE